VHSVGPTSTACGVLMVIALTACAPQQTAAPVDKPAAASAAISDVRRRVDSYATVTLNTDVKALSDNERQVLTHLLRAAQYMDEPYWQQNYGASKALLASIADPALRQLVTFNYGPWDKLGDELPLLNTVGAKAPGANLYPADITKAELDSLAAADRDNAYSLVRRDAQHKLAVIPYSEAFKTQLAGATDELRQAAALTTDVALKTYLGVRADALQSNDYRASDLAWMDMKAQCC
jgi:hypothetical protein